MNSGVVVTGASRGIGRACALKLAKIGFHVFAGVRKLSDAETLQKDSNNAITPIFLDITDDKSIQSASEIVAEAIGARGLKGLVNNAGIAVAGPLEFLNISELRRQLEVNVIGQVAVTQVFLPLLRQGKGRIVNISSMEGLMAMPFVGPYCASKFALEALSDSLRMEMKPWGVSVSVVEPAIIKTQVLENSIGATEDMVRAMPERGRELYTPSISAARKMAGAIVNSAIPSDAVVRAVVHALTAKKAKTRYIVGRYARLAAIAGKFLPDGLRDWYLCQKMGLVNRKKKCSSRRKEVILSNNFNMREKMGGIKE